MLTPTRDAMGVLHTALLCAGLGQALGVPGTYNWTESPGNICRGRNDLVRHLRQGLGRDRAWVLWVDADLFLADCEPVKAAITRAWETGEGFTAHYRMADGRSHLMRARGMDAAVASNYTQDEISALPNWHPIEQAGLGFAYLPMDLNYKFHADAAGEDVCFFVDTRLCLALAKDIGLRHRKTAWI